MNWKEVTVALASLGLISATALLWRHVSLLRHDVAAEVFGGQQYFDAFLSATNITVQRVHFHRDANGSPGFLDDHGFTNSYTYDTPLPITIAACEKIRHLLKNPASYKWDVAKGCIPEFGAVFHFNSEKQIVSLALRFQCREFAILDTTAIPPKRLNREDDFDPISSQLVAIAKTVFPNDTEIQNLK